MALDLQENRARLMSHFAGDASKHPNQWSALWDKGDFLPWDRGVPNPALADTLTDPKDLLGSCFTGSASGHRRRKKALVPGCGKGYDVLLLASFGYDAFGLEVSETAVTRCYEEQKANGHRYPVRNEIDGAGKVRFESGDFFSAEWIKGIADDGKVDLIYDYTVSIISLVALLVDASRADKIVWRPLTSFDSSSRLSHQASVLAGRFG